MIYIVKKIHIIGKIEDAVGEYGTIDLIDFGLLKKGGWEYKKVSSECGMAAYKYVISAIQDAMEKKINAVVTGPLNKESMHLAGLNYAGHTEIFAEKTGTKSYGMLLTSPSLKVIHCTTHCSLRDATDRIKFKRVLEVIILADYAMRLLGKEKPKIAVAGLNPHSSENGLFGSEEKEEICFHIMQMCLHDTFVNICGCTEGQIKRLSSISADVDEVNGIGRRTCKQSLLSLQLSIFAFLFRSL